MAYKRKYRSKSRSRQSRRRTGKRGYQRTRNFAAKVKKVIMRTSETKYFTGYVENKSMYHDRGEIGAGLATSNQGSAIFNPWYSITKGDTVSQRTGDEIYPVGMAIRLMYNCGGAPNAQAQFVRIVVAVIPKIVGGVAMDGTNFDLMDQAGSNDTVSGMIKREGVKCLYDRTTKLQTADGTLAQIGATGFFRSIYIRSKRGRKISWMQDGNIANNPVGVWVIPYRDYGSARSDGLGHLSFTYKLYFKDP